MQYTYQTFKYQEAERLAKATRNQVAKDSKKNNRRSR